MPPLRRLRCTFALAAYSAAQAFAQESTPPPAVSPKVHELGGDLFETGGIRFDAKRKAATFPAKVNMTEGLLEYLLVGAGGKTHESLLVTDVEPLQLHTVMLLLGAKGAPPDHPAPPSGAITAGALANSAPVKGDRIGISVRRLDHEKEPAIPVEDLIQNVKTHAPMSRSPWIYNGSYIFEGQFLAQEDKSIAALVDDPEALINNPRAGHDDDQIWAPNAKKLSANSHVEITITLLPEPTLPPKHKP